MVSIIIPFKDKSALLRCCVDSILKKTTGIFEIILIDNNSKEDRTKKLLDNLCIDSKIKILSFNQPFNFSAINNFAVRQSKGEFILFLNNDTEVISENWLEKMLECFEDKNVGAVGAKLLYPNGTIQHFGVMLEEKHLAIHAFRTWKEEDVDFSEPQEWSAVTGACMMTRKDLFEGVGGFDEENLTIAYNDIDYCLKIRQNGYKILCTPHAKLYHYESASRKSDVFSRILNPRRYREFLQEQNFIRKKWSDEIADDSFYKEEYF